MTRESFSRCRPVSRRTLCVARESIFSPFCPKMQQRFSLPAMLYVFLQLLPSFKVIFPVPGEFLTVAVRLFRTISAHPSLYTLLLLFFLLETSQALPTPFPDGCLFYPWSADSGWWCCPTFTVSIDHNRTVRVAPGVTSLCAAAFPQLATGSAVSGEPSEQPNVSTGTASVFYVWLSAGAVCFVCLACVSIIFAVLRRRRQGNPGSAAVYFDRASSSVQLPLSRISGPPVSTLTCSASVVFSETSDVEQAGGLSTRVQALGRRARGGFHPARFVRRGASAGPARGTGRRPESAQECVRDVTGGGAAHPLSSACRPLETLLSQTSTLSGQYVVTEL